jgi:hypothetical protein
MKTKLQIQAGVCVLITGMSATALAGDLINNDSRKYEVVVQCGAKTSRSTINSKTQQTQAFSPGCTVSVAGVGSIKTSKRSLVIKDGRMKEA